MMMMMAFHQSQLNELNDTARILDRAFPIESKQNISIIDEFNGYPVRNVD